MSAVLVPSVGKNQVLAAEDEPTAATLTESPDTDPSNGAGGGTACHWLPSHCSASRACTVVPAIQAFPAPDAVRPWKIG